MQLCKVPCGFGRWSDVFSSILASAVEQLGKAIGVKRLDMNCPVLATHAGPHIDEIFAGLLLRALYLLELYPRAMLMVIQRDSEMSRNAHPELYAENTVLIGIGGSALALRSRVVYDEHSIGADGQPCRIGLSATDRVVSLMRDDCSGLHSIQWLIDTINVVDGNGQQSRCLDLNQVVKDLSHLLVDCGNGLEHVNPLHAEAVVAGCLSAVAVGIGRGKTQDNSRLVEMWNAFRSTSRASPEVLGSVEYRIKRYPIGSENHPLTLANVAACVTYLYGELATVIMDTLFASLVQAQVAFQLARDAGSNVVQGYEEQGLQLECYKQRDIDQNPHRARLHKAGSKPTVVVVYDPRIQATLVTANHNVFPSEVWERFVESIMNLEPSRWYPVKSPKGGTAFILNRSLAHQDREPSGIHPEDYYHLLVGAVSAVASESVVA